MNDRFDAGITTIQSHPHIEHILAVGSYDNTVRLFDARKPLVPLTQVDVGGGAWRVKWHPSAPTRLALATMHDGFKVVDLEPAPSWAVSEVTAYREHQSLAYGVDWHPAGTALASCSFYDHCIALWRPA